MPVIRLLLAAFLIAWTATAHAAAPDCRDMNTVDMAQCEGRQAELLDGQLASYLRVAQSRVDTDGDGIKLDLSAAQTAWLNYRTVQCGDVDTSWQRGTIRFHQSMACTMALTRERLHDVWREYLTYLDSTPPILPEPCTSPSGCALPSTKDEAVRLGANAALARSTPPGERREILYAPMPVMPPSMVSAQATGRVFAQLLVEPDGRMSRVEVLDASDARLSDAVTDMVRWWRFAPNPARTTPYAIRQEFDFKTGE